MEGEGSFAHHYQSGSQAGGVHLIWSVAGYQREKRVREGFDSLGRSGMAPPITQGARKGNPALCLLCESFSVPLATSDGQPESSKLK